MTLCDVGSTTSLNVPRKLIASTKHSRAALNTLGNSDTTLNLQVLNLQVLNLTEQSSIRYHHHVINDEQSQGCIELRQKP